MKSIGLCPAVGSCHPNSGDPLYSLHAGFCRMVGSKTRKIPQKGPFLPNNTESESPFSKLAYLPYHVHVLGTDWHRRFTEGVRMGRHFLVRVVSCEPHGYHTSISICATMSLYPTPCPALSKRVSELYPGGGFREYGIRGQVFISWTHFRSDQTQKVIQLVLHRSFMQC